MFFLERLELTEKVPSIDTKMIDALAAAEEMPVKRPPGRPGKGDKEEGQ